MDYPKPVMKKTELKKMGFDDAFLDRAFRVKGQTFAWKSTNKPNSPILFDTEGLEKFRLTQCGLER